MSCAVVAIANNDGCWVCYIYKVNSLARSVIVTRNNSYNNSITIAVIVLSTSQ